MKVVVDQVEFRGDNPLTESQRVDLAGQIQKEPFVLAPGEAQDDWVIEANEVFVRGAFQDLGYMKLEDPHGTAYLNRALEHELHFTLVVEVKSGRQYRLGQVRVSSTKDKPLAFPEDVLRQQLELKRGDLFNASKVRSAMERITKLYSSNGYLDQVPEPRMDFDEKDSLIDLTLQIDEGIAYRLASVDVLGIEAGRRPSLPQAAGEPVNEALWEKYFEDNQALFPTGAKFASSIKMLRDYRDDAVRIVIDFHACPDTTGQKELVTFAE